MICISSETELPTFQYVSNCSDSLPEFLKQNPLRPSALRKEVPCSGSHCMCSLPSLSCQNEICASLSGEYVNQTNKNSPNLECRIWGRGFSQSQRMLDTPQEPSWQQLLEMGEKSSSFSLFL